MNKSVKQRADEHYRLHILPEIDHARLRGKILAIDLKNSTYHIHDSMTQAVTLGRKHNPEGRFYCKRIGHDAVYLQKGLNPVTEKK